MKQNTYTLKPMRFEKPCLERGRPSFRWVDGYTVTCPRGLETFPPVSMREAVRSVRSVDPKARIITLPHA